MPTASPSMTPSTGVTDTISTTPDSDSAARTPMPTPTSALRIGSPAPTRVPSMATRTIAAMTRPTSSPPPRMDGMPEAISVEKSTATPGVGCALNASWTALFVAGATSNCVSVNMTGATAALPSSDTSRIPDDIWSRAAPSLELAALCIELRLALVELGLLGGQAGCGLVERSGRLGLRARGVELGLTLVELG